MSHFFKERYALYEKERDEALCSWRKETILPFIRKYQGRERAAEMDAMPREEFFEVVARYIIGNAEFAAGHGGDVKLAKEYLNTRERLKGGTKDAK